MSTTISMPALRRRARRLGLLIRKSRVRDPQRWEYGSHWLVDERTNGLVAGGELGLDLEELGNAIGRLDPAIEAK